MPATLSADDWRAARRELARRLEHIGLHPPKFAKDIPEPFAKAYFDLMPIHKKLKANEAPTIHNYLRVTMCNIHEELSKRVDAVADRRAVAGPRELTSAQAPIGEDVRWSPPAVRHR